MRERELVENDLRTVEKMEKEGGASKGVYLLVDVIENQQLLLETLLDIRELLSTNHRSGKVEIAISEGLIKKRK